MVYNRVFGGSKMNFEDIASACTRIFEDKSIVRYKTILINPEKIFKLPVLSKDLDIQCCSFFTEDNGSNV